MLLFLNKKSKKILAKKSGEEETMDYAKKEFLSRQKVVAKEISGVLEGPVAIAVGFVTMMGLFLTVYVLLWAVRG